MVTKIMGTCVPIIHLTTLHQRFGVETRTNLKQLAASCFEEAAEMEQFDDMLTPREWCKKLQKSGAVISERALRTKARETGNFYSLGRAMLLTSKHIECLLSHDSDDIRRSDGLGG